VTSFGVTGHQSRPGIDWKWVRFELRSVLSRSGPDGLLWTCLATGADTIAAEEALASGLRVNAVIPHSGYEDVFSGADRETYAGLLCMSSEVVRVAPVDDREDAYLAAGLKVADMSELLLVVWDGAPAAGKGGTGDIARYAIDQGMPVIWLDTVNSCLRDISEAWF